MGFINRSVSINAFEGIYRSCGFSILHSPVHSFRGLFLNRIQVDRREVEVLVLSLGPWEKAWFLRKFQIFFISTNASEEIVNLLMDAWEISLILMNQGTSGQVIGGYVNKLEDQSKSCPWRVFQKRLNCCMRIISQSHIIGRDNGLADQEINYPDELVE